MKTISFISIILLALLITIANCSKKSNEPSPIINPDPKDEIQLIKKVTSDQEVNHEYTYYTDGRIKQYKFLPNSMTGNTMDFSYIDDTLYSHEHSSNPWFLYEYYNTSYRLNDSLVYVEKIVFEHQSGNPDVITDIDTLIYNYVYYIGDCDWRRYINEDGSHVYNPKVHTDENCSFVSTVEGHTTTVTLDDKHSYHTSAVLTLYSNYNVGNTISFINPIGHESTYEYVYNGNGYPISAIYYLGYKTSQVTFEYY